MNLYNKSSFYKLVVVISRDFISFLHKRVAMFLFNHRQQFAKWQSVSVVDIATTKQFDNECGPRRLRLWTKIYKASIECITTFDNWYTKEYTWYVDCPANRINEIFIGFVFTY